MTKLQVINYMLRSIGEPPVSSLEEYAGIPSVANAILDFDDANLEVQSEGLIENNYVKTFTRNIDDTIRLPENTLSIRRLNTSTYPQLVVRDDKLYNVVDETFEFTEDIALEIVVELPFEDLPIYVQNYIQAIATLRFVQSTLGSSEHANFAERQLVDARLNFKKNTTRSKRRNIRDNYSIRQIVDRRIRPRGIYDFGTTDNRDV